MRKADRGQALVETALLFPFLIFVLLLVVEFGFALHAYLNVQASAREAARAATVGTLIQPPVGTPCDGTLTIKGRAVAASADLLTCGEVSVTYWDQVIDQPSSVIGRGDQVVVRVTHTHHFITPLGDFASTFGFGVLPNSLTITACADARLERAYPNDPNGQPVSVAADCGS